MEVEVALALATHVRQELIGLVTKDGGFQNPTPAPAPIPSGRKNASAFLLNGLYYVCGGYTTVAQSKVEAYDPVLNTWTTKAVLPSNTYFAAGSAVDGKGYLMGGSAARIRANIMYDPDLNSWTTKANIPVDVKGGTAEVIGDNIYVVAAGDTQGVGSATCHLYSPLSDTWTAKATPNEVRAYHAAGVIRGKLYVSHGFNTVSGSSTYLKSAACYDPNLDTWTAKATDTTNVNAGRFGPGYGVGNGFLHVFGGDAGGGYSNICSRYNPDVDAWEAIANYPINTVSPAVPALMLDDGLLHLVGGTSNSAITTNHYVYKPERKLSELPALQSLLGCLAADL